MEDEQLLTMSESKFRAYSKARNKERKELIRLEHKYKKFVHDRAKSLYQAGLKADKQKVIDKKARIKAFAKNQKFVNKLSKVIPSTPTTSASGRQRLLNQLSQGPRPGNILNAPNPMFVKPKKIFKGKFG